MTTEAIARLRRAAEAMRAGRPVPTDDALPLADALDGALAGRIDIGEAFGLVFPSRVSPAAIVQRTELILKLDRLYAGTPSGRAKAMARDAARYATCWHRLRTADKPPPHHIGKPEAILFHLHRNADMGGAVWPLAWRSLVECLQSSPLRLQTFRTQKQ